MLVKGVNGKWYEVEDEILNEKEVDKEKALEAIAAERAERRKEIQDFVSKLDQTENAILKDLLLRKSSGRRRVVRRAADCDPMDCRPTDCQCMDCPVITGGSARKRAPAQRQKAQRQSAKQRPQARRRR